MAGAMVHRMLDVLSPTRLETTHPGSRRLKHLRVLVEVRCASASPRSHELAYVYKVPGDVLPRMVRYEEESSSSWVDEHGNPSSGPQPSYFAQLYGELLFMSTDNHRYEPGSWTKIGDDPAFDEGDLIAAKARRDHVLTRDSVGLPPLRFRVEQTRTWAPLVDLLDYRIDDDAEHAVLETRCRCGTRPVADRRVLVEQANRAMQDGRTRRVFV